jgi:hypothetical protein
MNDQSPSLAFRFAGRLLLFFVGLGVLYALVLAVVANVTLPRTIAARIQKTTNLSIGVLHPGGNTLERYRELEKAGPVDVLFVGSSHSYRSFDPEWFKERGVSTFNMGTTAQAPVNSYYLLERHMQKLAPKTVVYVLFWGVMSGDGIESFLDLSKNMALEPELMSMAWSIRDPRVLNAVAMKALRFGAADELAKAKWVPDVEERYVGAGYVESNLRYDGRPYELATHITVEKVQKEYLEKTIDLVQTQGTKMILVAVPVPKSTLASLENYDEYRDQIRALAKAKSIEFVDFNDLVTLKDDTHFLDFQHLNHDGVMALGPVVYRELSTRGLLPTQKTAAVTP